MTTDNEPEFWEAAFNEKKEMWGPDPAISAIITKDLFVENSVQHVLIPGIGYGRNARVFVDAGMKVTGIEISQTAIDMARNTFGNAVTIHYGSVTDMPFDDNKYDGVFCHALIHLLDEAGRKKLIRDCYAQLSDNGYMVFSVISKQASTYGQGTMLSKDRYEMFGGVQIFFYDRDSIMSEFSEAGLIEISEVDENYPFYLVKCKKAAGK